VGGRCTDVRDVPQGESPRWLRLTAPLAVVLVGGLLRLWHLGADDFWTDEVATLHHASSFATTYRDTHPPLYYLLTYAWLAVAPSSEFWLRLPSALMGTFGILATYLLARSAFDRATGVVAAGFVALSTMHIWHAQDARMYATLALLAAVSSWALLRACRAFTLSNAALYAVAATMLAYTHLFGLLTIAAHNAFVAYLLFAAGLPRRLVGRWIAVQAVVAASVGPWLAFLALNPGAERVDWIPPTGVRSVVDTFTQFSSDSTPLLAAYALLCLLGGLSYWLPMHWRPTPRQRAVDPDDGQRSGPRPHQGGVEDDYAGPADSVRRGDGLYHDGASLAGERRVGLPLMLSLLLVPMVLAYLISIVAIPLFVPRFLIAASIPLYVLAARGLVAISPAPARYAAAAIVFALLLLGVREYMAMPHKPPWRNLVLAIAPRVQANDVLVFDGHRPDVFDHYSERHGVLAQVPRVWLQADRRSPAWSAEVVLSDALPDKRRFWLIQFGADGGSRNVNELARRSYVATEDASVPGIRARLFMSRR